MAQEREWRWERELVKGLRSQGRWWGWDGRLGQLAQEREWRWERELVKGLRSQECWWDWDAESAQVRAWQWQAVGEGVGTGVAVAGTLVAVKLGVGKGAVGVDDGSGARVAVEVTAGAMVWLPLRESLPVQVTASAPKIAAKSHGCFERLGRLKDFTVSLAWLALSRTKWIRASGSDPRRDGQALVW